MKKFFYKNKVVLSHQEEKIVDNEIRFENGVIITCPNEILCSVEMGDRIIVLLNWYHAENLYNIYQNIFCYSVETGKLLWQVEHKNINADVIEDIFVGITVGVNIEKDKKEWYSCHKFNKEVVVKHFNLDQDFLGAGTAECYDWQIDPKTGKTTFLRQSK